jgi:hypothetical protein
MAVTVVGGYKNLVPKLFFRRGVIPEFDYFKKFQNPWLPPKVVTKEIWWEDFFLNLSVPARKF